MLLEEYGDKALNMFIEHKDNYLRTKDPASLDVIKQLVTESEQGGTSSGTQQKRIQATAILMKWDELSSNCDDIELRCFATGKTAEQLQKEDEEKERKRKQSEAWRAQGLCGYCGGQLGMFKKCKSCGKKN
jgi:hypothetical protein